MQCMWRKKINLFSFKLNSCCQCSVSPSQESEAVMGSKIRSRKTASGFQIRRKYTYLCHILLFRAIYDYSGSFNDVYKAQGVVKGRECGQNEFHILKQNVPTIGCISELAVSANHISLICLMCAHSNGFWCDWIGCLCK